MIINNDDSDRNNNNNDRNNDNDSNANSNNIIGMIIIEGARNKKTSPEDQAGDNQSWEGSDGAKLYIEGLNIYIYIYTHICI